MRDRPPPRHAASGAVAGYVLKLARESAGYSQTAMAGKLDVDLATVQGRESGRRPLAGMSAGALLDLRRRLPLLGAAAPVVQLLDAAMDADRIIGGILAPPQDPAHHPLAGWVHDRMTAHMIAWAVTGRPPPVIAARPVPARRGAVPAGPLLPAQARTELFGRLRDAAESADRAGAAAPLLRRQALYLTSYDRTPGAAAWTAHALHTRRDVLAIRGWSPRWAEARSTATALARQGDPQPLRDFIAQALIDDDRGEAANLNYWAYWLGAIPATAPDDTFMDGRTLSGWDPVTLLRLLVTGLDEAPTYVELYAHSLWALMAAHPWLPLAAPRIATVLTERAAQLLDGSGLPPQSRRDLTAVHHLVTDRKAL
jgi:hypothetical protein